MEFSLSRDVLFKLLRYASGIIEKKISHDNVLAQFLLCAQDSRLELMATDKDLELMCSVDNTNLPDFQVCLPFRKIYEICKVISSGVRMKFSFHQQELTISALQGVFVVPTYPYKQLPRIESVANTETFFVGRDDLARALQATSFVVVDQDMHTFVNGLLFEVIKNTLSIVATDGHRLAEALVGVDNQGGAQQKKCIIPKKGVIELLRLLTDFSDKVLVHIGDAQICFQGTNISFTSRLLVGNFPGHMSLVNPMGARVIKVDRVLLKEALMRVTALFFEVFCIVRLSVEPGLLVFSAQTPENDKVEDRISLDYEGGAFSIGFNGRYLLDALNHLTGVTIDLIFARNDSVVIADTLQNIKYVIMPLRE